MHFQIEIANIKRMNLDTGFGFVRGDMKTICKVTLLGFVGRDPEVRYTQSAKPIASFSLATEETIKGEKITHWHSCVAFDKLAEIIGQYVKKGAKLYCEGKIQYQSYEKDGEKRFSTKIIVNDISMLSYNGENATEEKQVTGYNEPSPLDAIPF